VSYWQILYLFICNSAVAYSFEPPRTFAGAFGGICIFTLVLILVRLQHSSDCVVGLHTCSCDHTRCSLFTALTKFRCGSDIFKTLLLHGLQHLLRCHLPRIMHIGTF